MRSSSVPRRGDPERGAGATSSALLLPLLEHGEVEAVVMLVRRLSQAFDERSVDLGRTLVDQAATALALVRARAEAGTDPVAGCMNHRAMRRRLEEEIGRAMIRVAKWGAPKTILESSDIRDCARTRQG